MSPALRERLSRLVARAIGSPLAKPIARVALAAAGLLLLAVLGRSAVAGAGAASPAAPLPGALAPAPAPIVPPPPKAAPLALPPAEAPSSGPPAGSGPVLADAPAPPSHARASPDDPVFLNAAGVDDLRRLPGIGAKRADAILALRTQLGRFRAVEDLLKVKGIGRATLKRLRPLVRLDPPAPRDAGAAGSR